MDTTSSTQEERSPYLHICAVHSTLGYSMCVASMFSVATAVNVKQAARLAFECSTSCAETHGRPRFRGDLGSKYARRSIRNAAVTRKLQHHQESALQWRGQGHRQPQNSVASVPPGRTTGHYDENGRFLRRAAERRLRACVMLLVVLVLASYFVCHCYGFV